MATAVIHSKIDPTNSQAETLRYYLELLHSELKDLHFNTDVNEQLDALNLSLDTKLNQVISA